MYQQSLEIYIFDNMVEIETSCGGPLRYFHLTLVFASPSCWVPFMPNRQEDGQALETAWEELTLLLLTNKANLE